MIKILHIASFEGNIGDNASHLGFLNILNQVIEDTEITRLEIRKAYRNYNSSDKLKFDETFANLANQFDCIIFGGGGFLDYWVEGSSNGTTIDIQNEIFDLITKPILITSIGSNPHRKVPKENYEKFESFLKYVKQRENITIALRNDGSIDSIEKDFGKEFLTIFEQVLDHGFFYEPPNGSEGLKIDSDYAVINITNDQLEMFNEGRTVTSKDWYHAELKKIVTFLVDIMKLKVVFVPHIYSDVHAISDFIKVLPDNYLRSKIIVAPCYQGDNATDFIFNIYRDSKLVIASRYHSNVCSMKFGKQTIGLSPLKRIDYIHKQFFSSKTSFFIDDDFGDRVIKSISVDSLPNDKKLENMRNLTLEFYRGYFNRLKIN